MGNFAAKSFIKYAGFISQKAMMDNFKKLITLIIFIEIDSVVYFPI